MSISKIINSDLIYLNKVFESSEDMMRFGANILYEKGFVTYQYIEGVLERESNYPTGLKIGDINCAIPHSEMDDVLEPAVLFLTLKEPLIFKNMENIEEDVPVNIVFMLAVNDGQQHLKLLQDLMEILRSNSLVRKLLNTKEVYEVIDIFNLNTEQEYKEKK